MNIHPEVKLLRFRLFREGALGYYHGRVNMMLRIYRLCHFHTPFES